MDNFEQKIIDAVTEKLNDGTIEKIIEEKIEKAVSDALDDVFRYSGKGRELIRSKLDGVMVDAIEKHDFNQYLVKLDSVLTEIINNTNLEDNKKILENFQGLMKEPEVKEIKLSEIFNRYCKHVAANVDTSDLEAQCDDDGDPYYSSVSAFMDVEHEDKGLFKSRFDHCTVKFTCKEDKSLNCQIRLFKSVDETKWNLFGGQESVDINSLRNISDFDVFLMTLNRTFVDIVMDTDGEYDDEIDPDEKPEWCLS